MPFDFGDEDGSEYVVQALTSAAPKAAESTDDLMAEAERRFSKAKYYEVLIKEPIFDGDTSPMAMEVIKEIQTFSRERLSILLGLKAEGESALSEIFSPEEIQVLKQVAAKLLKKPALGGLSISSEPTLKKARAPVAPAVKAAPAPRGRPRAEPKIETKELPVDSREKIRIPQKDGSFRDYTKTIDKVGDKEIYIGENGQRYIMMQNETGQSFMKSITRQARPVGIKALPPLTPSMMAAVAAQHVTAAIQQDEVAARTVSTALNNVE